MRLESNLNHLNVQNRKITAIGKFMPWVQWEELVGSEEDWVELGLERQKVPRFNDDSWVELERAADKTVS